MQEPELSWRQREALQQMAEQLAREEPELARELGGPGHDRSPRPEEEDRSSTRTRTRTVLLLVGGALLLLPGIALGVASAIIGGAAVVLYALVTRPGAPPLPGTRRGRER
jgi:hypothetical protein